MVLDGVQFLNKPLLGGKVYPYKKREGVQTLWHSSSSLTGFVTETKEKKKNSCWRFLLFTSNSKKLTHKYTINEAWKWLKMQEMAFLRAQIFKISQGNMHALGLPNNIHIQVYQFFSPTKPYWRPITTLWQNSFSLKEATVIVTSERCVQYPPKSSATFATVVYVALVFRNKGHHDTVLCFALRFECVAWWKKINLLEYSVKYS